MSDVLNAPWMASQTTAWLLTYLLHSTLFLGLATLAGRALARRRPALEEAAWRFALVAALVTASVQLASGHEPLAGRWGLNAPAAPAALLAPGVASDTAAPVRLAAVPVHRAVTPAALGASALPAAPASSIPLPVALAAIWALAALALCTRRLAAHLRLRRRLRARPEVVGGDMHRLLRRLTATAGEKRGVRLTVSSRLPVPIALGLSRREICVPPRALAALAAEQQESLLAHELAHLARRDPFWLAFSHLLAGLFFFQPLNWLACRRLREISELRSDEWAVERTGRPLSLARCLAEVAGWSLQPVGSLMAPGMADRPSNLSRRIRRLLDGDRTPERTVRPLWLAAAMAVLLIAVAAAAPGVSTAREAAAKAAGTSAGAPKTAGPGEGVAGGVAGGVADGVSGGVAEGVPGGVAGGVSGGVAGGVFDGNRDGQRDGVRDGVRVASADGEVGDVGDVSDIGDSIPAVIDSAIESSVQAKLADLDANLFSLADVDAEPALAELADLDAERADVEVIGEKGELSEKERAELSARIGALNERFKKELGPKIEELSRRMAAESAQLATNSEAMEKLRARAEEMARRARPSPEEIARLTADAEKAAREGAKMSAEERQRLTAEAREIAAKYKMTDQERAEIRELSRQAREESQRFMKEHRGEIEKMRREILEQTRSMREEVRRQIESDPELRALREKRREEIHKKRDESRRKRDGDRKKRDEQREKEKKDSSTQPVTAPAPPPKPA